MVSQADRDSLLVNSGLKNEHCMQQLRGISRVTVQLWRQPGYESASQSLVVLSQKELMTRR